MSASLERNALIVICAVSAGVHAALVGDHLEESAVTGGGFAAAAAVLVALVVLLRRERHGRLALLLTASILVGLLVSYGFAATTGIPVLHPDVDPVDGLALTTKILEAVGLGLALDLLRRPAARLAPTVNQPQGARS
jgi:uncharacterized protein (TIGR03382 family)